MVKFVTADEAAALIPDGAVVTVSSSSGLGCPDRVLRAIGERFAAHGEPRGLTTLHPIAAGDMYGIKGIDHLAMRIREVAEAHDVPLVENPPLARALYASVELDEEIPPEHFKAVAEVIGFIMRQSGDLPAVEDSLSAKGEPPVQ